MFNKQPLTEVEIQAIPCLVSHHGIFTEVFFPVTFFFFATLPLMSFSFGHDLVLLLLCISNCTMLGCFCHVAIVTRSPAQPITATSPVRGVLPPEAGRLLPEKPPHTPARRHQTAPFKPTSERGRRKKSTKISRKRQTCFFVTSLSPS